MAPVWADRVEDLQKQINDLEQKVSAAQSRERTLSSEIDIITNKISITRLEIEKNEAKLGRLNTDIASLSGKIVILEGSLLHASEVLANRIAQTYKTGRDEPLVYLLSSSDFADFWQRFEYLRIVQKRDKTRMVQMATTRKNYRDQKDILEDKKQEVEILSAKLKVDRAKLDAQNREKQALLDVTRNDERRYQELLAQALAEKLALERALVEGIKVGPVKVGDPIALTGNTGYPGCSTGKHLHFEIRKNNSWVDPAPYLSSKAVVDEENSQSVTMGSGDWPWPLQDTIRLTQRYGRTPYSWRYTYSGGIHTGLDLVSISSDVIKAPKDGTLYSSTQMCGGSLMNVKYIEHGDGLVSFYLHVQ